PVEQRTALGQRQEGGRSRAGRDPSVELLLREEQRPGARPVRPVGLELPVPDHRVDRAPRYIEVIGCPLNVEPLTGRLALFEGETGTLPGGASQDFFEVEPFEFQTDGQGQPSWGGRRSPRYWSLSHLSVAGGFPALMALCELAPRIVRGGSAVYPRTG